MVFHKKVSLKSPLNREEVREKLQRITESYHTQSNKGFLFEGKIKEHEFLIYPTFNYGPNEQLRPEIKGAMKETDMGTIVKIVFDLPSLINGFMIFGFLASVCVLIFFYLDPKTPSFFKGIGTVITILSPVIFWFYYSDKVDRSLSIIKKAIGAKNGS